MSFLHIQRGCNPDFQKVASDRFLRLSCEQFQTWLVFQLASILRSGQLSLEIVNRMSKQWKCFNMWYFPHKNISQIRIRNACYISLKHANHKTGLFLMAPPMTCPSQRATSLSCVKPNRSWIEILPSFEKILNIKPNRSDIDFEANQVRFQNSPNVLQESGFLYNLLDIE